AEIAIVHNGIIENYAELKDELIKEGHKFRSQTDTEVIVHLIEKYHTNLSLKEATRKALTKLKGSFALGIVSCREPDKLIGVRWGSPLVVGVGKNENLLASDIPALLDVTKEMIFLEDEEIAVLTQNNIDITTFSGIPVKRKPLHITWDVSQAERQGFSHFMLKEIHEQPPVLEGLLRQKIKDGEVIFAELEPKREEILAKKSLCIVACGTAYHAGLVGKYLLEELAGLPVAVDLSSEFRYRNPLVDKDTLVIAISQSGETADTLAAVREAKNKGAFILAICNVLGSSLTRESDVVLYTYAGPEISVASTKAYTAQIMVLCLFALYLGRLRSVLCVEAQQKYLNALKKIPQLAEKILKEKDQIRRIAQRHAHFGSFLYLGRNINYPSALEGALKLKEISYIPAEGYAAGEMKHGPIALIDEYRAVVCIAPQSRIRQKMISNIQEIKARRGKIIIITTEGEEEVRGQAKEIICIPSVEELFSPLLIALPLQLLAYYVAIKRGCNVDQPRNLAKSVTVE
ncbi:MAG: glutamine--fructose-6-phosphate transaminase (isomerizing), partial [Candidatus Omnitrophica bacterium]|nr:glutamine--fructose-6-phosphate transaminase (isomerizing) [Candidatus Omnitrophota bacterium]